ncbi:P-loop containing nucleoside triphosphate hydrolase protein [Crassisporium funariophilum]|nr:P-loop containing nucleoside triphosphate hydrolase protein [Crassisporium funariophilum]
MTMMTSSEQPWYKFGKNLAERQTIEIRKNRMSIIQGSQATKLETNELSKNDVIIAVMGPTGSGKSTFVKIASGLDTGIGHTLQSCTSTIDIVKLSFPEYSDCDIVFVDTPGFDDTTKSDVDILHMIANWLRDTYRDKILLSGIVYFHRISDNRMAGTPLKNLHMFQQLCGTNALENIILATTMWDDVDEETGNQREEELKKKYWRGMLKHNSTTARFTGTRESAFALLAPLINEANSRNAVRLQNEMVQMKLQLQETSAGRALYSKMEEIVTKRQDVLKRIRDEMTRAGGNEMSMLLLLQEYQELKMQLNSAETDLEAMKLTTGKRMVNTVTRALGTLFSKPGKVCTE